MLHRRHILQHLAWGLASASLPLLGACSTGAAPGTPTVTPSAARLAEWSTRWSLQLAALERRSGGRLGVSAAGGGLGATLGWREDERFALCSTFKLLLAGWVLALVDRGQTTLAQRIHYPPSAMVPYSPISAPQAGQGGLTVAELCAATVVWSDNGAANVLLAQYGGPDAVTTFLRQLGDGVTRLDRWEPELNSVPPGDVRDTTSPRAMRASTERLVWGDALSPSSRAQLVQWLRACRTGDKRLRAGAPGWQVGDKTGTFERDGLASDVAVLWPEQAEASSAPLFIACYLEQPQGSGAERDALIAEVARTVLAARAELRAF